MSNMREIAKSWIIDAASEMRERADKARAAYPEQKWSQPSADAYEEAALVFDRHAESFEKTLHKYRAHMEPRP